MNNLEWKILDFLSYDNDEKLNIELSLLKWLYKEDFQDIIKIPYIDGKTAEEFVKDLATWKDVSKNYWKNTKFRWSEQIALAQLYSNIFLWTSLKIDWKLWPVSISAIKSAILKDEKLSNYHELSESKTEKIVIKDWTKLDDMNINESKVVLKINSKKTINRLIDAVMKLHLPYEETSKILNDIYSGHLVVEWNNWKFSLKWLSLILNKWDVVVSSQLTKNEKVNFESTKKSNITSPDNVINPKNESSLSDKIVDNKVDNKLEIKNEDILKSSSKFEDKRTKESVSTISGNWFFNKWKETSRAEELNKLSSDSKASLSKILKLTNLKQIWDELKQVAPKDWIFKIWNHKQVEEVLTKYWYEFDSFFWVDEVSSVFATIIDYADTQSLIPSLDNKHKLQLLLDFNKDWKLWKEINNAVWELQSYFIVNESLSSDWIDIFMENLWLWTMNEFSLEMSNNLYSSREKFQRILWSMVEMKIKPTELVKIDWVKNALEDVYKNEKNISSTISKYLDEDELLKSKLYTLRDVADLNEINRIIKLEAVWAYVWSNHWVWVSFDIKKFVRGFVDSIQVWMINWTLWVSFTKQILEKNWFKIWVWLANFCIPLVWASYTYHNPKLKELLSNKLDWNYKPSIYAWISTVWQTIWLSIEKAWIDDNLKLMESNFAIIKSDLKKWNSFQDSEFFNKSVSKDSDEKIYEELKRFYDVNWKWKEFEDKFLDSMCKAYLHYYENLLYSNEIWWRKWKLNVTSVGWWIALVSWFMPVPYLTIWWEYLSQKFSKTHLRYESERTNTHTKIDKEKVWLKILENYNWKRVFTIPAYFQSDELNFQGDYKFSSPEWKLQAELVNWKFHFSGKDIKSISIDENIVSDKVERTIVINGWQLDENWLFVSSQLIPISESLPTNFATKNTEQKISQSENSIDTLNEENIDKTKIIRESIFNLVSKSTLNSPHANQLVSLQKMIFDFSTWKRQDIDVIWQAFNKFVFVSDFKKYADEISQIDSLNNLKNKLREWVFNEEQKILILQTIPACLMKSSNLVIEWWEVNIGKTISDYDKRWVFFDWLFEKSLPWLSTSLKIARKEWFEKNWQKNSYKFKTVADWSIAYVWNETVLSNWKKNVSWLMQYSNIYNVVDAWTPFINMPSKSFEIVNNLPSQYLQNLMNSLNENYWIWIKSISELKSFINNWWNNWNWIRFDYKLAYCKMWECMNDAIVIKEMKLIKSGGESLEWIDEIPLFSTATSEVYSAINNKLVWWVWVTWSKNEKDKWNRDKPKDDKPKDDNPKTDPNISNERPDIQPWNNIDE